jgi:hypothetical protein
MHQASCDYAEVLGLHNLDGGWAHRSLGKEVSDEDRQSFWHLISLDLYLRLIFEHPPAITARTWKVNLPWLDPEAQTLPQGAQGISFLVGSRLTLILIQFFSLLEKAKDLPSKAVIADTESLCLGIEQLLEEWQMVKNVMTVLLLHS